MRVLIVLLIPILLSACGKKKLPAGILDHDKMESVLWDMLQADEFLKAYMLTKDLTLNDTTEEIKMYERVFRINKVSREEFSNSFKYYQTHPDLFKILLDSLQSKKSQVPIDLHKEEQKKDTISIPVDSSIELKSDTNSYRRDVSQM
jgi:hypothetical protein